MISVRVARGCKLRIVSNAAASSSQQQKTEKGGMCEITDGRWGSGDQDDDEIKVELTNDVSPPHCTN